MSEQTFSKEQQRAFEKCIRGENVALLGSAGSGKSYILKEIINVLRLRERDDEEEKEYPSISVTASTGIAATLLPHASTLHSWFGCGLAKMPASECVERIEKSKTSLLRILATRILIIDEISMIQPSFFSKIDAVLQVLHEKKLPFGGIQVILCGDFAQLPPVIRKRNESEETYLFQTRSWKHLDISCILFTTSFRQATDTQFQSILSEMRNGCLTSESIGILQERIEAFKEGDHSLSVTHLYSHREDTNKINRGILNSLSSEKVCVYLPSIDWKEDPNRFGCKNVSRIAKEASAMIRDAPLESLLELRVGTSIIYTHNDKKLGLVNGSRGVVVGFKTQEIATIINDDGEEEEEEEEGLKEITLPLISFDDGDPVVVYPRVWEMHKPNLNGTIKITHLPIMYGWAVTIHKAQGMSLDNVLIDTSNVFAPGQAYVAFSRCRTLNGIILRGFDPRKIRTDSEVVSFYESLKRAQQSVEVPNEDVCMEEEETSIEDEEEVPIEEETQQEHASTDNGKGKARCISESSDVSAMRRYSVY
jgi:ATP-dependent DNA helicase PIF1